MSKATLIDGKNCFRNVCVEENYIVEFDPANGKNQNIWAGIYVYDIKEVNVEHHHITLEIALVIGWRDIRLTCKNQVTIVDFIFNHMRSLDTYHII